MAISEAPAAGRTWPTGFSAWRNATPEKIGIDPDTFQSDIPPTLPVVQNIIERFADNAPEEVTQAYVDEITGFLQKRHPKIACFQPAKQDERAPMPWFPPAGRFIQI